MLNEKVLNRRPEARGFSVEQLLQEASDGKLRIPKFQRPLRWKSKQVIEYFDSIRRGFPVGALLLSRDHAPSADLHFGPHVVSAQEQHNALWVIDGQQRITALVACLLRTDPIPKGDYWATWYDLENEEFVRLSRKIVPPGWIPLNVLCNSVDLLKWIRAWPYGDSNSELVDRALELGKAIREYKVPAYIVEGANEKLVRLIFTRVNTAGVGMREHEIFEARYGKEGDKPIRTAVARLTDLGFGEIDADLFLRCVRSTCGITAKVSVESPEVVADTSITRTEKAIRKAIFSIQNAAGIPHWKLLPYRMPLIFLSAFYDRFPSDDSRVDRLAAKWIWHGALSGEHHDVTDAYINRLLKQTQTFEKPDDALASLLTDFTPIQMAAFPNNPVAEFDKLISMNRASGKIFVLGLLAAKPKMPEFQAKLQEELEYDLFGALDDDDELAEDQKGKSENKDSESFNVEKMLLPIVDNAKLGTDVVIRLSGLRKEKLLAGDTDSSVLDSHLLDRAAIEFLNAGSTTQFRERRRSILERYFQSFVSDRIGDEVDLRPSISTIAEGAKAAKFGTARK
ncbi:MAG: DUF262 domain-containing protein [Pirellulaceae bacterium]